MSQHDSRISDSQVSGGSENDSHLGELDTVRLSAARARAADEAGATIARQLNGPLTALLLYMGEIKQHSHQFVRSAGDRDYLQKVVENALQQTERVCALVKEISGTHEGSAAVEPDVREDLERRASPGKACVRRASWLRRSFVRSL
jgi:signal transduction histidine kinase